MADLHVVDADPSEPPSHEDVVSLVNHLLAEFNIPTRISVPRDISASLFVVLYESLFSDRLPGIIRQPCSKEDEIHNCQIVIDVLSTDVVRDSLSHIRGVDIVEGDMTAISNLLDIFSYLLEYVVKRIESDVDHDDTRSVGTADVDGDVSSLTARKGPGAGTNEKSSDDVGYDIAKSNKTNNNGTKLAEKCDTQNVAGLNQNENRKAYDDHKIISHEDYYAMTYGGCHGSRPVQPPSPIKADQSQSLLGQKTVDSDCDILIGMDKIGKTQSPVLGHPKIAWDDKPSPRGAGSQWMDGVTLRDNDYLSSGAAVCAATTAATVPLVDKPSLTANGLSASMPPPSRSTELKTQDPLRSTVGPITYRSDPTPERSQSDRAPVVKGLSSSYSDLRQLVEKTAALTRIALETSPVRTKSRRDLDVTDIHDRPRPALSSEGVRLARELNAYGMSPSHNEMESPGKFGKKVAFATSHSGTRLEDRYDSDSLRCPLTSVSSNGSHSDRWCTYTPNLREGTTTRSYKIDDVRLPGDDVRPKQAQTKTSRPKSKKQTFAKHLAKQRQPELGAAHMTLKTEDRAVRKKQDMLRKFYETDHEEFKEDVEYMLGRDTQRAKETEEEYVQKCIDAVVKKKPVKKGKSATTQSTCKKPRISKTSGPKLKQAIPNTKGATAAPALKLESEEDLFPVLLEEFPHLHLSEHTWHELWRKGLHQIESLTRAYQESQCKKSQAKNQLEEAADKHELLSKIMRKQLEHAQRMRDVKEQRQLLVQMRNKAHEKRMQSARARRYYNEYQVRSRAKQLKRRTKEEMVFRDLFKDALNIQKERIKDIRQYANDQRKRQEIQRQNEIESVENFYKDQFEMLATRLAKERLDIEVRESAQHQMMERMKRELRKKMESEIKQYQEQMFRDDDDAHFRQVDADRVKQKLHAACYSAKI